MPPKRAAAAAAVTGEAGDDFPTRLVHVVHAAVCLGIGGLALLGPLREARPWPSVLAASAYAVVLVAVHLAGFCYGSGRFRGPALVAQAVLGLLPALHLGTAWSPLTCFFAGSLPLVAGPVPAVPVLVLVSGAAGVLAAGVGTPVVSVADGVYAAVFTIVAAGALSGLAWFSRLAAEREVGRRELTARVVAEERLRFARDTHDLLGLSLSAITLKVELVHRLVDGDPCRAKSELAELATISRKALADVRSFAAGKRVLSLAEERRSAAAVLETAGVRVCLGPDLPDQFPEPVAATFATMLRESAANVVRHSRATWCELAVGVTRGEAWLRVTNDGVEPGQPRPDGEGRGSGLRNLADRVGLLGGELSAGARPDGTHVLRAVVPLQPFLPPRRGAGRLRAIRLRWRS